MNFKLSIVVIAVSLFASCKEKKDAHGIEENQLGFINASVKSEDTNLKNKATFGDAAPGTSTTMQRSFENAPPLIPHTTQGFFPIKKDNNICLSCHMPDKVKESGAKQISATHFISLRPKLKEEDGKLHFENENQIFVQELDSFNNAYFNCSQCHVPQANVKVNIENLFTPEFRKTFGLENSDLKNRVKEGIE